MANGDGSGGKKLAGVNCANKYAITAAERAWGHIPATAANCAANIFQKDRPGINEMSGHNAFGWRKTAKNSRAETVATPSSCAVSSACWVQLDALNRARAIRPVWVRSRIGATNAVAADIGPIFQTQSVIRNGVANTIEPARNAAEIGSPRNEADIKPPTTRIIAAEIQPIANL
ncbi:MAG: hypothetical protein GXP03_05455 [Alphaproteobacteria bacterium]|nr:hypothetical protein [Alphaproteobacteria bacterium]